MMTFIGRNRFCQGFEKTEIAQLLKSILWVNGLSTWCFATSVSCRSGESMLPLLSLVIKFLPVFPIYEAPQ